MGSKVKLFEAIRRDARVEELSIRGLADRYGVHWRTARQSLALQSGRRRGRRRCGPCRDWTRPRR